MSAPRIALFGTVALAALSGSLAFAAGQDRPRVPIPRPQLSVVSVGRETAPADAAAPLPRPRPAIEPPPETLAWADSAAAHFRDAGMPAESAAVSPPDSADVAPARTARRVTAIDAIDSVAPIPRPRPEGRTSELALMAPRALQEAPFTIEPADTECLARLRALGVAFTEEVSIDPGGTCNVDHPLNVTVIAEGIALSPTATLDCRTAESLAEWVQRVVVPIARDRLGEAPTKVMQDSAYVCRPRNNEAGAKLSEHAHANAIDIDSFEFAGRAPVAIGRGEGVAKAFEAEIRKGSCDYFTTVLGPGSNAAHATHFHLDMAQRRHGYRLCELGAPELARAP